MSRLVDFVRKYGYAAASTGYLFTLGVRSARHRGLIGQIARHFGYREAEELIPSVELADLGDDREPVRLVEPMAADGNVSLLELLAIVRLLRAGDARRIFEIGTFDGRTTLNLAANAGPSSEVFTLDLPAEQIEATAHRVEAADRTFILKPGSGTRWAGRDEAAKITQLYGDSASFDFAPFAQSMDFVFVDGAHSYEYVLSDSRVARALLRPSGGTILWHDYGGWPGVTRALNELYASGTEPFDRLRRIAGTSLVVLTLPG